MPLFSYKRIAKLAKALHFTKLPFMPFILNIEPGNICNLHCPLCPTGQGDASLSKGFISFELFKNIFSQLKEGLISVNLYSWGEPLLNRDFINIIRYIKSYNKSIRVVTSTNLNIRDDRLLTDLILSGIDEIIVSCDGANAQSYSKYRVGGDFDLVMQNLRFLAQKKKELSKNNLIVWNFLVFKHNENEIEQAREMASSLGVSFRVGLMRTSMKDEILKPHRDSIARDINWIPDNSMYSAYDKDACLPKKRIKTCRKPWGEITVNWDGKIFPCCAVYGDKYCLGDAKDSPIKEIWNNKMFISSRKEILNHKIKGCTVCGLCRDNGFMHM